MNYKRKGGEYIAFYVGGEIGKIEYYGKVKSILKNIPESDLPYKITNLKSPIKDSKYKIYHFQKLIKLKKPIFKGNSGAIKNIRNTTLEKLKKSKDLSEI